MVKILSLSISLLSCALYLRIGIAHSKPDILVIDSYHKEFAWVQNYHKGLNEVLEQHAKLTYFEMDTKRREPEDFPKIAELALETYKKINPALVIVADDNALKYLATELIKSKTPVVYLGINNSPREYFKGEIASNITGVLERPLLIRSIRYISSLAKNTNTKTLVLFDKSASSDIIVETFFKGKTSIDIGTATADLKLIGSWQEWKDTVKNAHLNGYNSIICGTFYRVFDKKKHIPSDTVLKWSATFSQIPLFGFWNFTVAHDKAIGGFVLSGVLQGKQAAHIALKILNGENPQNIIPEMPGKGELLFSKKGLKKFNIELPPYMKASAKFVD